MFSINYKTSLENQKAKLVSQIHKNQIDFPITRDYLSIEFDENRYIRNLRLCEMNLSKLNIPFNELYSKRVQSKDEFTKNPQIILNPELFDSIKNHIHNIEKFVSEILNTQKMRLNYKIMNRLINCENACKEDLIAQLMKHKDILCDLHNLITEMERIVSSYYYIKDKIRNLLIDNKILRDEIKEQNDYEKKLKNNIKYYKINIRKFCGLIDEIQLHQSSSLSNISKKMPNKNVLLKKTFCLQTEPNTMASFNINRTSNSFHNTSEKMKKTVNIFSHRTTYYNKETKKLFGTLHHRPFITNRTTTDTSSFSQKSAGEQNQMYKKIIQYMNVAKQKFIDNNKMFSDIYKNKIDNELFLTRNTRKIINDEGYRRVFIDKIVNDVDIIKLCEKKIYPTVDFSKFKLLKE